MYYLSLSILYFTGRNCELKDDYDSFLIKNSTKKGSLNYNIFYN